MSSPVQQRLPLLLFRAILRWSNKAEGVPFQLRHTDILKCTGPAVFSSLDAIDTHYNKADVIRDIARQTFKFNKDLQVEEQVNEALDQGLEAVQLLHTEYADLLTRLRSAREVRADRSRVAFSLGTVFTHKKFGYKGVVYGWDRECERDPAWAAAVHADPTQPFYHVLPDEDDCQRIFRGIRLSKYVAQDNMEPVLTPRRVNHRAISHYFDSYSPDLLRYVPNHRLQYEYPDNYDAAVQQSCLDDSNVLEGPETEEEPFLFGPQHHGEDESKAECGRDYH
ncbi:g89 [Coccomyxa elongata]